MKLSLRQDLVGACIFLILSLVLWFFIPIQILVEEDDTITAQTFPRLIIGLMALCSFILLIKELLKWLRKEPVKRIEIHLRQELHSFIIFSLLVGYWIILNWLPFMPASLIFATLLLCFFQCRNWRYYAIIFIVIISVSLLFQNVLNVNLP